jgi:hypothetical protein
MSNPNKKVMIIKEYVRSCDHQGMCKQRKVKRKNKRKKKTQKPLSEPSSQDNNKSSSRMRRTS